MVVARALDWPQSLKHCSMLTITTDLWHVSVRVILFSEKSEYGEIYQKGNICMITDFFFLIFKKEALQKYVSD